MEIKDKLYNLRNNRGLSMDELSLKTITSECPKAVSTNTIADIESGKRQSPGIKVIERLATALNVSPMYFFSESARTVFDVQEINEALTDEIRQMLLDKETLPYLLLAKKAYTDQIPPEIVEELLRTITKVRNM